MAVQSLAHATVFFLWTCELFTDAFQPFEITIKFFVNLIKLLRSQFRNPYLRMSSIQNRRGRRFWQCIGLAPPPGLLDTGGELLVLHDTPQRRRRGLRGCGQHSQVVNRLRQHLVRALLVLRFPRAGGFFRGQVLEGIGIGHRCHDVHAFRGRGGKVGFLQRVLRFLRFLWVGCVDYLHFDG